LDEQLAVEHETFLLFVRTTLAPCCCMLLTRPLMRSMLHLPEAEGSVQLRVAVHAAESNCAQPHGVATHGHSRYSET
jgi:hypothetical protein